MISLISRVYYSLPFDTIDKIWLMLVYFMKHWLRCCMCNVHIRTNFGILLTDKFFLLIFEKKCFCWIAENITNRLFIKFWVKEEKINTVLCESTYTKTYAESNFKMNAQQTWIWLSAKILIIKCSVIVC